MDQPGLVPVYISPGLVLVLPAQGVLGTEYYRFTVKFRGLPICASLFPLCSDRLAEAPVFPINLSVKGLF